MIKMDDVDCVGVLEENYLQLNSFVDPECILTDFACKICPLRAFWQVSYKVNKNLL